MSPSDQTILIDCHYLPCLEYFATVDHFKEINWEQHEHYAKQSYRNRCRILTAQGPMDLIIPIKHHASKMKTKDVQIDYGQKWVHHHWQSIQSAYGKAPFFPDFSAEFRAIYEAKPRFLMDLNEEIFHLIEKLLCASFSLKRTTHYLHQTDNSVQDWRGLIHPKKGQKNNPFYQACTYNQIFGKKFVANLSIIDLLFSEGPNANTVLKASKQGT